MALGTFHQQVHRHRALAYAVLAGALLVMICLSQFLEGDGGVLIWRIGSTVLVLAGIVAVGNRAWQFYLAIALSVPRLASSWMGDVGTSGAMIAWLDTGALSFDLYLAAMLFSFVFQRGEVSGARFFATMAGYLMLIWLFAAAYTVVLHMDPEAIRLSQPVDEDASLFARTIYFSTITQTTVGYGDLVPVSKGARALVLAQSLMGVLYLAVAVAGMVGSFSAQSKHDDRG